MNEYDVVKARDAQSKLIKEKEFPYFPPSTGVCYSCGKNIYEAIKSPHGYYSTGITVESAGKGLITGCPHCHRSYCD